MKIQVQISLVGRSTSHHFAHRDLGVRDRLTKQEELLNSKVQVAIFIEWFSWFTFFFFCWEYKHGSAVDQSLVLWSIFRSTPYLWVLRKRRLSSSEPGTRCSLGAGSWRTWRGSTRRRSPSSLSLVSFMAVGERKQTNNAGGDGQADGQKLQKRVPWSGFSPGIFCGHMITEKDIGIGNALHLRSISTGRHFTCNCENEENRCFR